MGAPGFQTDTDALRWFGSRCGQVSEEIETLNRRTFHGDAVIADTAWGGKMMYLTALGWHLARLKDAYERARRDTATRNDKIAVRLDITDVNLHRVAQDYDDADQRAVWRQVR